MNLVNNELCSLVTLLLKIVKNKKDLQFAGLHLVTVKYDTEFCCNPNNLHGNLDWTLIYEICRMTYNSELQNVPCKQGYKNGFKKSKEPTF